MSKLTRALTAAAAATGVAAGLAGWAAARSRPEPPRPRPPVPPGGLPPARMVTVPGRGEFWVRDTGPSDQDVTMLLLHGWMFPSDLNWFPSYEPLSASGRVIAMDHRGHGHGLRPAEPFRLAHSADDAAALVRHLGVGPVVAVGYSMGGPIAQLLWRRHRDVVRGLVLCATADTFNDSPRDRWLWRAMGGLQLALRILPRHSWERLVERQASGDLRVRLTTLLREDTPEHVRALIPWFLSELARGTAEDVAEAGRELGRYDGRAFTSEIDVPTVAIVTTEDQLVPVDRQRAMAARIPACESVELPLDHDAAVSGAEAFVPALVKAVQRVVDAD
jgi:pimeloyl-ACP methyl ester carboxylesterase